MFEIGRDGPSQILVAIDGSDTSMRAGSYAAGLARRQGVQLILLFVHTLPAMAPMVPAAGSAMRESTVQLVREIFEQARVRLDELGIEATFIEREGDPYDQISQLALELRVDAIVVGASASPGHRVIGSLGVRLVKAKICPVTVVP